MAHIPQRTCIACRTKRDKNKLLRIVRDKNGDVFLDFNNTLNGRGAYIDSNQECFDMMCRQRALNRVFKTNIPQSSYDNLLKQFKSK